MTWTVTGRFLDQPVAVAWRNGTFISDPPAFVAAIVEAVNAEAIPPVKATGSGPTYQPNLKDPAAAWLITIRALDPGPFTSDPEDPLQLDEPPAGAVL